MTEVAIKKSPSGQGNITKISKSSYKIKCRGKYYCSCRTYEQADYVRKQLIKHNWDKNKLPEILDQYPEYYTQLLYLYQYIRKDEKNNNYILMIPKKYNNGTTIGTITYNNIEDALYERDFLVEHDWDYELLIECIEDDKNPYYTQELPPFPERRIRNLAPQNKYDKKILEMQKIIKEDPDIHQKDLAQKMNVAPATIISWLKRYKADWLDFKTASLRNDNVLNELTRTQKIYLPDLKPSKQYNFNNYIYTDNNRRSKYRISRKKVGYGSYPTREIADKVVRYLNYYNWDKSKLPLIQKKVGVYKSDENKYIYKDRKAYTLRKKINKKMYDYGRYPTIGEAKIARSIAIANDWMIPNVDWIQNITRYVYRIIKEYNGRAL